MSCAARPRVGDKVIRREHVRRGRSLGLVLIGGVVLVVLEDERAPEGWMAIVRWWWPSKKRWSWEAHSAYDFGSDGCEPRIQKRFVRRKAPSFEISSADVEAALGRGVARGLGLAKGSGDG
jgi:hypothetical protein